MFGSSSWRIALPFVQRIVPRRPASNARLGTAIWLLLFLSLTVASLAVAYETAMHFTGVAIDGPFQLYNAMRRIQAGFTPGVDFQFFHGLGVAYAHYPLYRAFGGGLRGSELARELLTTTLYAVVFLAVFRAFTRRWAVAIALSAAGLAASYLLHMSAMLFALNSMLSLRSALPMLLAGVAVAVPKRRRRVALGVTLGLSLFVSTEQGLAATAAFVLVSIVPIARGPDRRTRSLALLSSLSLAIAVLLLALLSVGGWSGMLGALRYNFRIVPMDQYWFFGAPPNVFVPSWGAGLRMLVRAPDIGLAVVLGVAASAWYLVRVWREAPDADAHRTWALAYLAVYGVVSCASLLGVFTLAYAQPCWRCLLVIGLSEVARVGGQIDAARQRPLAFGVPRLVAATTVLLFVGAMATIPLLPIALTSSAAHIVRQHLFGSERFSAGGIWPETLRDGQRTIDAHRGADGKAPVLWSTYAGWIEARNGLFQPSFDYIIHALGPENRAEYVARFRATRPTLVQTVRPTYTQYEAWLENADWTFYDALLDGYRVASTTPWSFYWEARTTPAPALELIGSMNVPAGLDGVQLPPLPAAATDAPTLIEVEIGYETHNPWRRLPVIGASPRYLVGIDGALSRVPVSLDPFVTTTRFPLLVRAGQRPTLRFLTYSLLPGASWVARTIRLYVRPVDDGERPWLEDLMKQFAR